MEALIRYLSSAFDLTRIPSAKVQVRFRIFESNSF